MTVKQTKEQSRKNRIRSKIKKNNKGLRSRIVANRSNQHIYLQLIDIDGFVKTSYSSLLIDKEKRKKLSGIKIAEMVGSEFAKIVSKKHSDSKFVFDRGSYKYTGRIKALSESCKKSGIKF